jgi:hypothetical protein
VRVAFSRKPEQLIHPKWAAHFAAAPEPQQTTTGVVRDSRSDALAQDEPRGLGDDESSTDLALQRVVGTRGPW